MKNEQKTGWKSAFFGPFFLGIFIDDIRYWESMLDFFGIEYEDKEELVLFNLRILH